MDNDDRLVGRVLTRREALAALAGSGLAALLASCVPEVLDTLTPVAGTIATSPPTGVGPSGTPSAAAAALPACVVRPELTAGPFFVDERLNRSDIRSDPATGEVTSGVRLDLEFLVSQITAEGCTPLPGAYVDVWHCDAQGAYSDVQDASGDNRGQQFLRGYQRTDDAGRASFTTVYPGWYGGRAVHIHFKVRTELAADSSYDFTSQLFFPEQLNDQVHQQAPYAGRGPRTTRNEQDGIYRQAGPQLTLEPQPAANGYEAVFDLGLQLA